MMQEKVKGKNEGNEQPRGPIPPSSRGSTTSTGGNMLSRSKSY
jgi:hypothetical protein